MWEISSFGIEQSLGLGSTFLIDMIRSKHADFDIVQSNPTILAGLPGHKYVYEYKVGEERIKGMSIVTVKESTMYFIQFNARASEYEVRIPAIQKLIHSIELDEPSDAGSVDHKKEDMLKYKILP